MTSRERLLAAYARRPVDRMPCSPRLWAWLLERYGAAGPDEYLRCAAEFDFDPHYTEHIFPLPYNLSCAQCELPGVEQLREERTENGYTVLRRVFRTTEGELTDETRFPPADASYGIDPNPIRTEYLVKSPEDLKRLPYLIPDKGQADFAAFHAVERKFGERGLVMVNIFSPLCHRAGDVYPMEELMMAALDDRPFFDALLDLFHREMMTEVRACLRAGILHIFCNWYYNSLSAGWSPRIWEEAFAPHLVELASSVHAAGGTVNFYDDGKCMPLLELFADCGIDVLQTLCPPPVGDVNLAEAKRRIGGRVCLMGHVDLLYVIQRGTPELIEETVRKAIETAGPTGFILGTSDSIRNGTPLENVQAYFAAAKKYGACDTNRR